MSPEMERRIDELIADLPPLTDDDFHQAAVIFSNARLRRRPAAA